MRHPRSTSVAALTALLTITLVSPTANAAVYNPPWADVFSFAYPGDSTGKSLSSRTTGKNAVYWIDTAGYNGFDQANKSSATSMGSSYAQSDAIWAHFGHSRKGAALFWNGSSYSELMANSAITRVNSNWGRTYLNLVTGINDVRLMVFGGCYTANDGMRDTVYEGNLLATAIGRGVDSAIGFRDLVYWPHMDYWGKMFFDRLYRGDTVTQAAASAASYVDYALGTGYWGTNLYTIKNGSLKTMPVGYGTP